MPNVYWIKGRSPDIYKSVVSKIDRLFSLDEMNRLIAPERSLAVKINMSELGYSHYLPPVVIATLFEKLRDRGAVPVVTDSSSLFKGSRFSGYDWVNTALAQGFSNGETFDNQMMLAGGYTGEEGNFYPTEGEHLGGIDIGSLMTDSGNIVVISHVTAHPLMGIAGAVSNLGLGFLTVSGKLKVHDSLKISYEDQKCDKCRVCLSFCPTGAISENNGNISFDSRICNNCMGCFVSCPAGAIRIEPEGMPVFQESVVEAAHTVKSKVRDGAFFINFLSSVTPQTDDYPYSDVPFIPDMGILASEDPVAADWATYQMIMRSPGVPGSAAQDLNVLEKGDDKIKAITGVTPVHMLEYAEKMGLGTREFEFMSN
jgi:hypothetical protein